MANILIMIVLVVGFATGLSGAVQAQADMPRRGR
jgi:hypothetical protein